MTTIAELGALIDEPTLDADDDEEKLAGFHVGAADALCRGERATIAGVVVESWRQEGHVEPTEAAWRLLEQAVEPRIEDFTRRARLGSERGGAPARPRHPPGAGARQRHHGR